MNKNFIQLPRYLIKDKKSEAIIKMTDYVNQNLSNFKDGEEIVIRYQGENNEIFSVNAIINFNDEGTNAKLSVELGEQDTVKIVDSTDAPDKDSLWVREVEDEADNLRTQVQNLKRELEALRDLVKNQIYQREDILEGGNILPNSTKNDIENSNSQEKPSNAIDYTPYAEDDFDITDFNIYLGNVDLEYYSSNEIALGCFSKYFPKCKFINKEGEIVKTDNYTMLVTGIVVGDTESKKLKIDNIFDNVWRVVVESTTKDEEYVTLRFDVSATIDGEVVYTGYKNYELIFVYEEKPDYYPYKEPNSPHITIRWANTEEEMFDNANYLCLNEFVWCVATNSLYLKAKSSSGTIALFKINGNDTKPIQSDEEISFSESSGILKLLDKSQESIYLDENNILVVNSDNISIDENNVLTINLT